MVITNFIIILKIMFNFSINYDHYFTIMIHVVVIINIMININKISFPFQFLGFNLNWNSDFILVFNHKYNQIENYFFSLILKTNFLNNYNLVNQ